MNTRTVTFASPFLVETSIPVAQTAQVEKFAEVFNAFLARVQEIKQ